MMILQTFLSPSDDAKLVCLAACAAWRDYCSLLDDEQKRRAQHADTELNEPASGHPTTKQQVHLSF